jgi:hypothetical protein
MKVSIAALVLLSAQHISAQQVEDFIDAAQKVLPANYMDTVAEASKPVKEALEPYKVKEGTKERGVPQLHDDYDCEKKPEDP